MTQTPPSLWAMGLALAANATAFASLGFGILFLWVVAPNWPPPALIAWVPWSTLVAASGFAVAFVASRIVYGLPQVME